MTPQNFLRKLIGVLEEAEDLESLKDLHKLCTIAQLIRASAGRFSADSAVLLNDNNIFEYVMAESIFFGMLGMLECASAPSRSPLTTQTIPTTRR